jgi:hypothetical protein
MDTSGSRSHHHRFEMKAKVTGIGVSEREKAWSIMYPAPPMAEPPSPNKQPESMYVLIKLKPLVREDIDINNDEEVRILTIRRDDVAELGLKVGDIIKLRLSTD